MASVDIICLGSTLYKAQIIYNIDSHKTHCFLLRGHELMSYLMQYTEDVSVSEIMFWAESVIYI